MEFWGVEVKPKQSVKCEAGDAKILHLSQASLGEIKKDKGSENVPIFVKVNDKKLVLGTLSAENCAQIQYDLIFEKEFELSHGSKDTSVFFVGYKSTTQSFESDDDFSDYESSDEDLQIENQLNEKDVVKNHPENLITAKVDAVKDNSASSKSKPQPGKPDKAGKPKANDLLKKDKDEDEDDDDDDDSEEESDDDDEEIPKGMISSDDEDEEDDDEDDDDSSEDEKAKLKAENGKKRSADGLTKPSADKKAKLTTPVVKQKSGGKAAAAAPPSAKQAGKTPASFGKAKEQTPKSIGSLKCNSCSKPFNSENALQAHTKAKHSTSK